MKTLKQRLHPQYQTRLIFFKKEYPALGERLEHDLITQKFVGDLTLSVLLDLKTAFKIKQVTDAYDCFESIKL